MLIIRSEQIATLQLDANRRFARRIRDLVRTRVGEVVQQLPDAPLEDAIAALVLRAQGYGISADNHLLAFVDLAFCVSRHFDRHPPIHQILSDDTIAGDDKIRTLLDYTSARSWDQAARSTLQPDSAEERS